MLSPRDTICNEENGFFPPRYGNAEFLDAVSVCLEHSRKNMPGVGEGRRRIDGAVGKRPVGHRAQRYGRVRLVGHHRCLAVLASKMS